MDESKKPLNMVSADETQSVSRALFRWLNTWPDKPVAINYEYLPPDGEGMALSTIQGAFKLKEYIRGGYIGQYQFRLMYRVQPGNSNNNRLSADEILDSLGTWALKNRPLPDLGPGRRAMKIKINSLSSVFANYPDGSEDHQILMTMDYSSIM